MADCLKGNHIPHKQEIVWKSAPQTTLFKVFCNAMQSSSKVPYNVGTQLENSLFRAQYWSIQHGTITRAETCS